MMAAPHNPKRYGEIWPQERIDLCLKELEVVKDFVIVSGGWAWHFMSPLNHRELKHAHDHKDIDLFVDPENVATVVGLLKGRGFEKKWTRYDRLPSKEEFRRYEKTEETDGKFYRITIDFFVSNVPSIEASGYQVVEPKHLLSLYSNIHSSDKCFAVQAAAKLLDKGIDPVLRDELVNIPE